MAEKNTLGRQKISMAKIENEEDLYSSFSKRRETLYKKASNMIGKYDIVVGIITFSPSDNPFSFFHPTIDVVVDRFFSPYAQGSENSCLNIANTRIRIKEKQVELDNLEIIKETLPNDTTDETGLEEMWEQIKEFNLEDLKKFERRLDEVDLMLKNVATSFAQAPQENAN
ncbi:agamous-like MADS-box protein AGL61 [Solanum verrucosum]|uniref:agamous-like MADS-box protein AGL61 n=1 Tax=Solanum verrucosum TaxID=315347 RepID=UPI0020D0CF99|nr:agamous-like MADS-box protein AGL61 [Solanum verrucosum]